MNTIAERIYDFLKNFPPFSMLSKEQLLPICKAINVHYLEKETDLFITGNLVKDHFYVVKDGAIGLFEEKTNALVDKSKKAVVNVSYDIDTLLFKAETLLDSSVNITSDCRIYFEQTLNQLKQLYNQNNFNQISIDLISELKYIYNLIVLEYIKSTLNNDLSPNESTSRKGDIIDVDIAD